jgi:ferritin
MLNPKLQEALNKQINAELYSAYLYASMSAYFESLNLKGMAHWMRIQVQEELAHVVRFYNFVNERHGRVLLAQIAAPKTEWKSVLEAFEDSYKHECLVTGLINELVNLAIAEKDHAANAFLQWFVNEQVEEEASVVAIVDKLKLVGDHGVALFMIDNELAARVMSPTAMPATPV